MAKKKSSKKHSFKHSAPATQASPPIAGQPAVKATATGSVVMSASDRDFRYVGRDLRHIAVLAGSLILLEVVLWYVINHTGFGTTLTNLIKL